MTVGLRPRWEISSVVSVASYNLKHIAYLLSSRPSTERRKTCTVAFSFSSLSSQPPRSADYHKWCDRGNNRNSYQNIDSWKLKTTKKETCFESQRCAASAARSAHSVKNYRSLFGIPHRLSSYASLS